MAHEKGKNRRLGSIDLETGEILEEGLPVWVKAKVKWHEEWMMVMQEALGQIAQDRSFTWEMWRVWSFMISKLGFENWIIVPQTEIAEALQMQKTHVSRAVKSLLDKGMILRGPKVGRTNAYKLNSRYAWKGKINNLKEERLGELKDFYAEANKRGFSEIQQKILD